MKTHYETLGVSQHASPAEIKEYAQAKANEIKAIFGVLSNADKRKAYDTKLKQADSKAASALSKLKIRAGCSILGFYCAMGASGNPKI